MGAKSSKKKQGNDNNYSNNSNNTRFSLYDKRECFVVDFDVAFEVFELERSTAAHRQHNSHGLPNDVLALIATHLDIRDVGRAAQTCKVCHFAHLYRH